VSLQHKFEAIKYEETSRITIYDTLVISDTSYMDVKAGQYKQMYLEYLIRMLGHAVAYLDEALCYKTEGRGFDSR
jgi:hypothetical protein